MAGQPITLTLPSIGDAFPTAATQITTAITALETELERKVVPADMSMTADLSFVAGGTNRRAKDLLATSYVLNASALSAATYPRSLYFTGTDGDVYANDGAGRQIRLTSNGAVYTAASGNITSTGSPAYGASGVELRWDGADLEYELRSGSGANDYADVRLDDVVFNDGSSNSLRLTAPSLSSDYTLTLPTGVATGNNSMVQLSTAGALSSSTTPTLDGLTLANSAHVKHGEYELFIPAHAGVADNASLTVCDVAARGWVFTAATGVVHIPISLVDGARFLGILVYCKQGDSNNITCYFDKTTGSTGAATTITSSASTGGAGIKTIGFSSLTANTYAASADLFFGLRFISANAGDELYGIGVLYDCV